MQQFLDSHYQPRIGDVSVTSISYDAYSVKQHNGDYWQRITMLSEEEAETFTDDMELLGEDMILDDVQYYRPSLPRV